MRGRPYWDQVDGVGFRKLLGDEVKICKGERRGGGRKIASRRSSRMTLYIPHLRMYGAGFC